MTTAAPLAQLEAELIVAALSGDTLPGSDRPLRLADLRFATGAAGVVNLSDEALEPGVTDAVVRELRTRARVDPDVPETVRVVDVEALRQEAERDVGFLRLRVAETTEQRVQLAVEVCVLRPDAPAAMPLETLFVSYAETRGQWQPEGPPLHSAT